MMVNDSAGTAKRILKEVYSRELKNGECVVVAAGTDALVVDKLVAAKMGAGVEAEKVFDEQSLKLIEECGFCVDEKAPERCIPKEMTGRLGSFSKGMLIGIGCLSLVTVISLSIMYGVPVGDALLQHGHATIAAVMIFITTAFITTIIHEMAHMYYSGAFQMNSSIVIFNWKKAIASVPMSHIWVWSLYSRVCAIAAGIIADLLILSCVLVLQVFFDNWVFYIIASALWVRILWQFRFHRNCDGRLLILTILDAPYTDALDQKGKRVFKVFCAIGIVVELIIIVLWLGCFAMKLLVSII